MKDDLAPYAISGELLAMLVFFALIGICTVTSAICQVLVNTWKRFWGAFQEGLKGNADDDRR